MPELSAPATVLVLRIADRLLTYQKYQKWWAQRPAVSVRQLPGAWWQHACQAVTAECRSRYPVRQMRQSLALRAQYIRLYRMLHSRQPYFAKDHARGPREQAVPAKALAAQLQELERKLTLAQAMMYRTCVALKHSIYLGRHEEEYLKCLTAMDLLATFVDALPQASPSPLETTSSMWLSVAAGLRVSVRCPRLGLRLVCQAPAAGHGPRPGHGSKGEAAPMTAAHAQAARSRSHAAAVVLSVEGVQLLMPSLTSLVVQGRLVQVRTISATPQQPGSSSSSSRGEAAGAATAPPSPSILLSLPAALDTVTHCKPKFDFRAPPDPAATPAASSSRPLQIHQIAFISSLLSAWSVRLAGASVTAVPAVVSPGLQFTEELLQALTSSRAGGLRSKIHLLSSSRKSSLRALVTDSYIRHGCQVPLSLSSFLPKLQLRCPQVVLRYQLSQGLLPRFLCPPSSPREQQLGACDLVLNLANLAYHVRCVGTAYGSLCQVSSVHADLEMLFQAAPSPLNQSPPVGHFTKLWLHPSDLPLLYPETPQSAHSNLGDRQQQPALAAFRSSLPGLQPTLPYVPVLMARNLAAQLSTQVPVEPSVPGQNISHLTLCTYGVCAWFSTWQVGLARLGLAELVMALVESALSDPLVTLINSRRKGARRRPASPEGPTTPTPTPTPPSLPPSPPAPVPHGSPEAEARPGASRVSVLLEVPLLTLLTYTGCQAQGRSTAAAGGQAAQCRCGAGRGGAGRGGAGRGGAGRGGAGRGGAGRGGAGRGGAGRGGAGPPSPHPPFCFPLCRQAAVSPPAWVTAGLGRGARSPPDLVLAWGLQLVPLLALHLSSVRAGASLTGSDLAARLVVSGLHVSNQLLSSRSLTAWGANSGSPTLHPQGRGHRQAPHLYLVAPLPAAALACTKLACDRRRVMLALPPQLAPSAAEARAMRRHLLLKPLEMYMVLRAADYALFLLTRGSSLALESELSPLSAYSQLLRIQLPPGSPPHRFSPPRASPPAPPLAGSSAGGRGRSSTHLPGLDTPTPPHPQTGLGGNNQPAATPHQDQGLAQPPSRPSRPAPGPPYRPEVEPNSGNHNPLGTRLRLRHAARPSTASSVHSSSPLPPPPPGTLQQGARWPTRAAAGAPGEDSGPPAPLAAHLPHLTPPRPMRSSSSRGDRGGVYSPATQPPSRPTAAAAATPGPAPQHRRNATMIDWLASVKLLDMSHLTFLERRPAPPPGTAAAAAGAGAARYGEPSTTSSTGSGLGLRSPPSMGRTRPAGGGVVGQQAAVGGRGGPDGGPGGERPGAERQGSRHRRGDTLASTAHTPFHHPQFDSHMVGAVGGEGAEAGLMNRAAGWGQGGEGGEEDGAEAPSSDRQSPVPTLQRRSARQPSAALMHADSDIMLSFVTAFMALPCRTASGQLGQVSRLPCSAPVLSLQLVRRPRSGLQVVKAEVTHLTLHLPIHSLVTILRIATDVTQALKRPRKAAGKVLPGQTPFAQAASPQHLGPLRAPQPPAAPPGPHLQLVVEASIASLHAKVLLEEAPGMKRPDCMTELASVTLLDGVLHLGPGAGGAGLLPGRVLRGSLQHLALEDLQGAVEHRSVLAFGSNASVQQPSQSQPSVPARPATTATTATSTVDASEGASQDGGPSSPLLDPGRQAAVEVLCVVPDASAGLPLTLAISLRNPRLLFLRKFLNNILYAVSVVSQAMASPRPLAHAAAPPPAPAAANPRPPAAVGRPPVITIQEVDVTLPGDCRSLAALLGSPQHRLTSAFFTSFGGAPAVWLQDPGAIDSRL
ncbi:hypothetical protein V8C86DRAFT_3128699, partial [Haematococcus lacustris]